MTVCLRIHPLEWYLWPDVDTDVVAGFESYVRFLCFSVEWWQ